MNKPKKNQFVITVSLNKNYVPVNEVMLGSSDGHPAFKEAFDFLQAFEKAYWESVERDNANA